MVSNVRASIGVSILIGLTLSVLLMLMATVPAQAETLEECQAKISSLRSETENATTFLVLGKNAAKAEEGLLLKLDDANAKLSIEGKYADASQKLTDFRNTVIALEEGGKVDPVDASELIAGANEAIVCVEGLGAQAPTVTA
jgi:hypothetical protein